MNWQDLKQRFTQCGDVKYAEIKMDNGRSKGFGTVKFHSEGDAQRAISTSSSCVVTAGFLVLSRMCIVACFSTSSSDMFNGTRIDGRTIEVRLNRI